MVFECYVCTYIIIIYSPRLSWNYFRFFLTTYSLYFINNNNKHRVNTALNPNSLSNLYSRTRLIRFAEFPSAINAFSSIVTYLKDEKSVPRHYANCVQTEYNVVDRFGFLWLYLIFFPNVCVTFILVSINSNGFGTTSRCICSYNRIIKIKKTLTFVTLFPEYEKPVRCSVFVFCKTNHTFLYIIICIE